LWAALPQQKAARDDRRDCGNLQNHQHVLQGAAGAYAETIYDREYRQHDRREVWRTDRNMS
jgi:hypothetical protein